MSTKERAFYTGENIRLVVPTIEHVENSSWASWFNSQRTSQYTSHAIVTNTVEDQRAFYLGMRSTGRFALLITALENAEPVGVVSLSAIDYRQGTAAIAIVMDTETDQKLPALASLEAMARMTIHAFDVMGLKRIEAGQVFPDLKRWARLLELLGYRAEGFKRQAFARGQQRSDVVALSCLYASYRELSEGHGGTLWPGSARMLELIRNLPRVSLAERLDRAQRDVLEAYLAETRTD